MVSHCLKEVLRQAQHERNINMFKILSVRSVNGDRNPSVQIISVRPEPVEGQLLRSHQLMVLNKKSQEHQPAISLMLKITESMEITTYPATTAMSRIKTGSTMAVSRLILSLSSFSKWSAI